MSDCIAIRGQCHCGNIRFTASWPSTIELVGRECSCTYCRKQGAVWTSHPDVQLTIDIRQTDAVTRYHFGHQTAKFHVCGICGIVPFACAERTAVININTFETPDPATLARRATNFDGELPAARAARRASHWSPFQFLPLAN